MQKTFFAIVFIFILLLTLVSIALLPVKINSSHANKTTGYVQIKVLEANTLKPVSNATVCIIEDNLYTQTNANGDTSKLKLNLLRNTNYDNILLRNWGEFTILIYKQGYATHISFYNEVYAGITRIGIICYLSAIKTSYDKTITTNVNLPNSNYLETLIMHYKK